MKNEQTGNVWRGAGPDPATGSLQLDGVALPCATKEVCLTQQEAHDRLVSQHPEVLTKSFYKQLDLAKPLFKMTTEAKVELLRAAVEDLTPENAYDIDRDRLISLGLQAIWRYDDVKSRSELVALESLIALQAGGGWAVGLIIPALDALLDTDLDSYIRFKTVEIGAAVRALQTHRALPMVTINMRPTDWLIEEVQAAMLAASEQAAGRIAFELTEYCNDRLFAERLEGVEGTLSEKLSQVLLPILRNLKEKGVQIYFDDVKPSDIYVFDDAQKRKEGLKLCDTHATASELMLRDDWRAVACALKVSIEYVSHALSISKETEGSYRHIPIYKFGVKDSAAYVASVQDLDEESGEDAVAAQLAGLRMKARTALQSMLKDADRPVVLEATLPPGALAGFECDAPVAEQGGLLFEVKAPPCWYLRARGEV